MRKNALLKELTCIIGLAFIFLLCGNSSVSAVTILDTDAETVGDGCIMLGVEGNYEYPMQKALDRINEIRKEACDEGVPDPRNKNVNLTPDDYTPIKWSTALEQIARIRAAEGSVTMGHVRLTNKSVLGFKYGGISPRAEVLAWFGRGRAVVGVNMWYSEKSDWVKQTNEVTGHYTSMIDPDNKYVGLGMLCYRQASMAGEFSKTSGSLGEEFLPEASNVVQSVEAKKGIVKSYYLDGPKSVLVGTREEYIPKAKTVYDGVSGDLWLLETPIYKSSNNKVAEVTSTANGIAVKGLKDGTTTVTATLNGTQIFSQDITVETQHSYIPEWTWGEYSYEGYTDAMANLTCSVCGEKKEYLRAKVTKAVTKHPTCNTKGETTYTATVTLDDGRSYTDTRTREIDFDLVDGHEYETTITKATPEKSGHYLKKCRRCGDVWSDEDIYCIDKDDIFFTPETIAYTGSARKPTVSIYVYDGYWYTKLDEENYTVSYADNVNVGTGKAIITFRGDEYEGSITKNFTISKAPQKLKVSNASKTVKYKALKKKAQNTTKISVTGAKTGCTYKKVSGSSKLSINNFTGRIKVKKKCKKGTYSIKVKVTTKPNRNYKTASKTVTVKVKVK